MIVLQAQTQTTGVRAADELDPLVPSPWEIVLAVGAAAVLVLLVIAVVVLIVRRRRDS